MDSPHPAAGLWALGNYAAVGQRLAPAARRIADEAGDGHGRRALDLATGTGSVALALSARAWAVSAIDVTAPLLDVARHRADREDLVVDWREASVEALPFRDEAFALVASSFGIIFAPDPEQAVLEARRCLRPGGRFLFTAWRPDSYFSAMTAVMRPHLPHSGPVSDPFAWGDRDVIARLVGPHFTDLTIEESAVPWEFDDVDAAIDFCFDNSPGHVAAGVAAGPERPTMVGATRDHLRGLANADGTVSVSAEYLVVSAVRK